MNKCSFFRIYLINYSLNILKKFYLCKNKFQIRYKKIIILIYEIEQQQIDFLLVVSSFLASEANNLLLKKFDSNC